MDKKLHTGNYENSVLEIKLKEKEQEIKLNELKIKELRK